MLIATYLLHLFILFNLKILKFFSVLFLFYDTAFNWLVLAVNQSDSMLSTWVFFR